jgi:hypothetical protein
MDEKTIGRGRQDSVLFTYGINKDECERRRSTADPTRKASTFARTV